ncbi:MAG: DUF721 domain-containing protein [Gammaproteobacteria bacterium]|nr:DUF721 domain-containing protein [Gammaproteobacteria bacterium]
MSIISLQNLLKSAGDEPLEQLVRRASAMDQLATSLRAGLGAGLAPHLAAANLRPDGALIVVADSSAWAARLRFETEKLMEIAGQAGIEVSYCRVVVASDRPGGPEPETPQA